MKQTYRCPNPQCADKDHEAHTIVMDQESVMDDQNMAQMFCPRCKSRLETVQEDSTAEC